MEIKILMEDISVLHHMDVLIIRVRPTNWERESPFYHKDNSREYFRHEKLFSNSDTQLFLLLLFRNDQVL